MIIDMSRGFGRFSRVPDLVTEVDGGDVVVRYADPERLASSVRVWAHLRLGDTSMTQVDGGWEVRLTDLPVDRLEYLLDVDGDLRPDPSNERLTPGPFGDHSWIPLPGYREPAWLDVDPCDGDRATLTLSRTGAAASTARSGRRPTSPPASRCRCSSATMARRWTPTAGSRRTPGR
jgi:hypothetical protein